MSRKFVARLTETPCPDCGTPVPYYGRGQHPRCDPCGHRRKLVASREWRTRNRDKLREYQKRADAKRPRTGKDHYERIGRPHMIRTRWGMTVEEYDAILAQGCAICGTTAAVLDHCHQTGQIRGPLCGKCNMGIAFFRDRPDLLRAAIVYLGELPT